MIRTGHVVSASEGSVRVEFERETSCAHCKACDGTSCSVTLRGSANVGDTVDVFMPDSSVTRLSLLTYGLPLVLLIAGLLVGRVVSRSLGTVGELVAGATALAFLLAGVFVLRVVDGKIGGKEAYQPRIVSREIADDNSAL